MADEAWPPLSDLASTRALFARLIAQGQAQGLTWRAPPPEPSTCCGRGCNGCVWEGFYAAATGWRDDALAALQAAQATGELKPRGAPRQD